MSDDDLIRRGDVKAIIPPLWQHSMFPAIAALEPTELAGADAIKDALASLDMARDKLTAALNAGKK